ncbi:hypothetical protein [Nocardiopsis valliformis]|nr:hypothetical protein [Nocardiopsis valliformis]
MNLQDLATDPTEREAIVALQQQFLALAQLLHDVPEKRYTEPAFGFDVAH